MLPGAVIPGHRATGERVRRREGDPAAACDDCGRGREASEAQPWSEAPSAAGKTALDNRSRHALCDVCGFRIESGAGFMDSLDRLDCVAQNLTGRLASTE